MEEKRMLTRVLVGANAAGNALIEEIKAKYSGVSIEKPAEFPDLVIKVEKARTLLSRKTIEVTAEGDTKVCLVDVGAVVPPAAGKRDGLGDEYILDAEKLRDLQVGYKIFLVGIEGSSKLDFMFVPDEEYEFEETEEEEEEEVSLDTVESQTARIVSEGIVKKAEVDARVKAMRERYKVDDGLIVKVLKTYQPTKMPVERPTKLYAETGTKDKEGLIKKMIRNITLGHSVILEGPKSLGKNVAWETVAWLFNKPLYILKMSAQITKDEMVGMMSTDNTFKKDLSEDKEALLAAAGYMFRGEKADEKTADTILNMINAMSVSLKFQLGILGQWLVDGNGILILDEMNLALPNTLSAAVNSLADDHTTSYEIPGYGIVPISPNCVLGATQNGSSYLGTNEQNAATSSRFVKFILKQPESILNILKDGGIKLSNDTYELCDSLFSEFRKGVNDGRFGDDCLSIRGFLRALRNHKEGEDLGEALRESVANHCPEEERQGIVDIIQRVIG